MNKSNRRTLSKKRRPMPQNRKTRRNGRDGNDGLALIQQVTRPFSPLNVQFPDKMRVTLRFTEFIGFNVPIGSQYASQRFRPSSAYDVDPVLGSTAVPGFTEMANIYGTYRVVSSRIKVEAGQNGSQSMASLVVVPLNADPGASPSSTVIASWFGTFHSKRCGLANIGGPIGRIVNNMTTERIFGTKAVYFDDNFASAVTGNPTNNWYWAIGAALSGNASGSAVTISGNVEIDLCVEFFNRLILTT